MNSVSIVSATLAAALAGCATSPTDLRADPGARRSFQVQAGYQVVLKRLEDYNSECVTVIALPHGGDAINDVRNYSDLRRASIMRGIVQITPNYYQILDLEETEPGRTKVDVYAKVRLERVAYVFEQVARGLNRGCDPEQVQ